MRNSILILEKRNPYPLKILQRTINNNDNNNNWSTTFQKKKEKIERTRKIFETGA